jgi:hypothetical protein
MSEQRLDPKDFWYGPGGDRPGDKAGMRCVASMTGDEAKQALCNALNFGIWHHSRQSAYRLQDELRQAAVEQLVETVQ